MKVLKVLTSVLATLAVGACTVHKAEAPPPLSGPSGFSLSVTVTAIPDTINFDGGSQASVRISAIGPDGRPKSGVSLRVDMFVNGVPQDFGTLSARTVVTNADGIATVVYTAPPTPPGSNFGTCLGLSGTCVEIVATPTGTAFDAANPQSVRIRLVPPGVILPPASTPTAAFTFSPSPVVANQAVIFDASSSQPGSGASQIVDYSWNFGDGSTGSGRTITHTFDLSAAHSVTLTVTNDRGLSSSTTQSISVGAGALPTPNFTFSPASPRVNDTVFFNGSTSTAGAGHTITSFRWAFGDGTTGSGATTQHIYTVASTYNVQLTVTDEAGQSVTSAPTAVAIGTANPTAVLTVTKTGTPPSNSISADGGASSAAPGSQIVSYTFVWGDGTASTTVVPPAVSALHTYAAPGTYTVRLNVTDNLGRTGTITQPITVP
jgi:PKD repeat protein